MDDDEFEDEVTEPPSVRWSWLVVLAHLFEAVETTFGAMADCTREIKLAVCHHHNYKFDQRDFAEQARAEIESIPTQEG